MVFLTRMVQMLLTPFCVPVSSRGDVEITLDLVSLHAAKDATRVGLLSARQSRGAAKLLAPSRLAEIFVHILLFLVLAELFDNPAWIMRLVLAQLLSRMPLDDHARAPRIPHRRCHRQHLPREHSVSTCVLHVDMQVFTLHCDDDVQVQLQVVRDALLHAEGVCRRSRPPAPELGDCEPCTEDNDGDGPHAAIVGFGEVGLLGFRCFAC